MNSASLHHVLCVEDNAGDRLLIKRFFDPKGSQFKVHFLEDGLEALDFLHKKGKFVGSPRPEIVILDLNLQRIDGKEVLSKMKQTDDIKDIPVFILTTSKSFEDKRSCLELGAEQFFTKPSDINSFEEILRYIQSWVEEKPQTQKGKPPTKYRAINLNWKMLGLALNR